MDHRAGPYAEFEAFVAGAAGRLLHVAVLLTAEADPASGAECPVARRLLAGALARTYAHWGRVRGDDPYDDTRRELCARYARTARRCPAGTGILARLSPPERLVLVLRVYEGVAEEVAAAQLGLTPERVRVLCNRAVSAMRPASGGTSASGAPASGRGAAGAA